MRILDSCICCLQYDLSASYSDHTAVVCINSLRIAEKFVNSMLAAIWVWYNKRYLAICNFCIYKMVCGEHTDKIVNLAWTQKVWALL